MNIPRTAATHVLPDGLRAFAEANIGPLTETANYSWPHERSRVWKITARRGTSWYLKQHASDKSHAREMTAYAQWTTTLGTGRAPRLLAADPAQSAILITALPGSTLFAHELQAVDERQVHHQLGVLLRALHNAAPARPPAGAGPDRGAVERKLATVEPHLASGDAALVLRMANRLASLALLPEVPTHGDFQLRNTVWDQATRMLGLIDWERSEYGPAVRDLIRLEYGPWDGRPDLKDAFFTGFGRPLTSLETDHLHSTAALDALSGIAFGIEAGDTEVFARGHRTLARLRTETARL